MTPDEVRKHVLEIQARAEKATPGPWHKLGSAWIEEVNVFHGYEGEMLPEDQDFIASARSDVPWLCEQLLEALKREDALISLRRNEMKNISSKEPLIVADSLGRNPDGAVRLLPDPSKPWLPLVED